MAKCLAFFSAGRLARQYGTYDMTGITGACSANKLWGTSLIIALLSLFGAAPFSIFASELFIVKAAIASGRYVSLILFLVCSIIVFVAAIRRAIDMCAGQPDASAGKSVIFWRDYVLVISLIGTMIVFGIAMPYWYKTLLVNAATIADATAGLTGVFK
jgi:formate hydrogenlyase subunit 3/multisubunit Na+/H+ antiporter MnhD subunit